MTLTLADLCDAPTILPPPDRPEFISVEGTAMKQWVEEGVMVLPWFMPDHLIDAYCKARKKAKGWEKTANSYMTVPEVKDLCLWGPLATRLRMIFGEDMGMHINLCGERGWHTDSYLTPDRVGNACCAIWFALDTDPKSGSFEYVPGSHRSGRLSRGKVIDALLSRGLCKQSDVEDGSWPHHSEKLLTPLFEKDSKERGWKTVKWCGDKGDILIWHSCLWHRGSSPETPGTTRKSLIAHYYGVTRRQDFRPAVQHGEGGWYFPFETSTNHPKQVPMK